jgi:hypothetical protein
MVITRVSRVEVLAAMFLLAASCQAWKVTAVCTSVSAEHQATGHTGYYSPSGPLAAAPYEARQAAAEPLSRATWRP